MKNRVIYIEDKIYVYIDSNSTKNDLKKIRKKVDFIKSNYGVDQTIMVYDAI